MDPEGEQGVNDCEIEDVLLHPDFIHLNPDHLQTSTYQVKLESCFQPVTVDDIDSLIYKTRNLNFYKKSYWEGYIWVMPES